MGEQPDQYRVTFYCDQCARRSGYRHALAMADRGPWPGWRLRVARRLRRRLRPEEMHIVRSHSGGAVPDNPRRVAVERGRRLVLTEVHPLEASAAQLVCRDCTARPRVALAKLMELADQAEAAGRRDAYV